MSFSKMWTELKYCDHACGFCCLEVFSFSNLFLETKAKVYMWNVTCGTSLCNETTVLCNTKDKTDKKIPLYTSYFWNEWVKRHSVGCGFAPISARSVLGRELAARNSILPRQAAGPLPPPSTQLSSRLDQKPCSQDLNLHLGLESGLQYEPCT